MVFHRGCSARLVNENVTCSFMRFRTKQLSDYLDVYVVPLRTHSIKCSIQIVGS